MWHGSGGGCSGGVHEKQAQRVLEETAEKPEGAYAGEGGRMERIVCGRGEDGGRVALQMNK